MTDILRQLTELRLKQQAEIGNSQTGLERELHVQWMRTMCIHSPYIGVGRGGGEPGGQPSAPNNFREGGGRGNIPFPPPPLIIHPLYPPRSM